MATASSILFFSSGRTFFVSSSARRYTLNSQHLCPNSINTKNQQIHIPPGSTCTLCSRRLPPDFSTSGPGPSAAWPHCDMTLPLWPSGSLMMWRPPIASAVPLCWLFLGTVRLASCFLWGQDFSGVTEDRQDNNILSCSKTNLAPAVSRSFLRNAHRAHIPCRVQLL